LLEIRIKGIKNQFSKAVNNRHAMYKNYGNTLTSKNKSKQTTIDELSLCVLYLMFYCIQNGSKFYSY